MYQRQFIFNKFLLKMPLFQGAFWYFHVLSGILVFLFFFLISPQNLMSTTTYVFMGEIRKMLTFCTKKKNCLIWSYVLVRTPVLQFLCNNCYLRYCPICCITSMPVMFIHSCPLTVGKSRMVHSHRKHQQNIMYGQCIHIITNCECLLDMIIYQIKNYGGAVSIWRMQQTKIHCHFSSEQIFINRRQVW